VCIKFLFIELWLDGRRIRERDTKEKSCCDARIYVFPCLRRFCMNTILARFYIRLKIVCASLIIPGKVLMEFLAFRQVSNNDKTLIS